MLIKEGFEKMKSSNRWLIAFVVSIAVLVFATIALVLSARPGVSLLPENTPEGAVQRFLMAVQDNNYEKAYSYLSLTDEKGAKISYEQWLTTKPYPYGSSPSSWKAILGKTTVTGERANVEVTVDVFRPSGPFGNAVQSQQVLFQLARSGESWLITSPPYLYWIY